MIVIQENRSFDNIFAGYPHADAPLNGKLPNGSFVPLQIEPVLTADPYHSFAQSLADIDGGKMDGFANGGFYGSARPATYAPLTLSRLDPKIVAPYWSMAQQYTLADRMFPTEHGPSWTAHLNLVASTTTITPTKAVIDFPINGFDETNCHAPGNFRTNIVDSSGNYGIGPYPCFTQFRSMADTLDEHRVSWRYYAPYVHQPCGSACGGQWSPFASIKNVADGPDWSTHVISPPQQVLTDLGKGTLADVTWIAPESPWSDHAYYGALPEGPSWVGAIVNAIGKSNYWNDTAIFVLWDEWGGWYDDAIPPKRDFRGNGIRVPCIIISPYSRHGVVSHTTYEYGSILKFIEETYGLEPLGPASFGYTDSRAASVADSFDFTQTPKAFVPISVPYPPSTFINAVETGVAPDND